MAEPEPPSRRSVVRGLGAGLMAIPLLSACGGNDEEPSARKETGPVPTGDVPVGEGVITTFGDRPVVVTQPTKGDFKGFSAICTHQGCTVQSIHDGVIQCPCHGSQFSVRNGSVIRGPASRPLPTVAVEVRAGKVRPVAE